MRTAIYPGSFDPVTNGHLDVIRRAALLFDRLVIAVADNSEKRPLFATEARVRLIRGSLADLPQVEVTSFRGLLVDFAHERGAVAIVRGLRAVTDFEYEFQMALMNRTLRADVETVFVAAREEYTYLSSRIIKEVARLGGDIARFVPPPVETALLQALKGA
ncbi:MAG: pantetheine-phosphate adenylyltransferase [Verrucomicrobiota bacterium]